MYGPDRVPSYPKKLTIFIQVIGWLMMVYSVWEWLTASSSLEINMFTQHALAWLFLLVGLVSVLCGNALSRITAKTKYDLQLLNDELTKLQKRLK